MKRYIATVISSLILAGLISALAACQYADEHQEPLGSSRNTIENLPGTEPGIFGDKGLQLFGPDSTEDVGGGAGIGVNSQLWRASLDTISFMPLSSADPFGGVIITDWYAPPDSPSERFKMTIFILARTLRADGLRVSVFRQQQSDQGIWIDSSVNPSTATSLENKILERARQLRTGGISE